MRIEKADREINIDLFVLGFLDARKRKIIHDVYQGYEPEEATERVYYFLISNYKFDLAFEKEISGLDLKIARKTKHSCSLMAFPTSPDKAREYSFLERCIYRK